MISVVLAALFFDIIHRLLDIKGSDNRSPD
jgi:hypothetical protein